MNHMFGNCEKLHNLDLSSFTLDNISHIKGIFFNCNKSAINSNKSKFKGFKYEDLINE